MCFKYHIYIKETKNIRVGEKVFFKHKCLTQPSITQSDALIKAAEDVSQALKNKLPDQELTQTTVQQLIQIFRNQAEMEKQTEKATEQRVQRASAAEQRVQTDAEENLEAKKGWRSLRRW